SSVVSGVGGPNPPAPSPNNTEIVDSVAGDETRSMRPSSLKSAFSIWNGDASVGPAENVVGPEKHGFAHCPNDTVVAVVSAALFVTTGSAWSASTRASLVCDPLTVGLTLSTTVADAFAARLPSEHSIVPFAC